MNEKKRIFYSVWVCDVTETCQDFIIITISIIVIFLKYD